MYKHLPFLLALALGQAKASSIALATCDGVTNTGSLTAACNDGSANAAAAAASMTSNGGMIFNLSANSSGTSSASAFFDGEYQLIITQPGVTQGTAIPTFNITNPSDVVISINGSQGAGQVNFVNGTALFSIYAYASVAGGSSASADMSFQRFFDQFGADTPAYEVIQSDLPLPEPSQVVPIGLGLLVFCAKRFRPGRRA